MTVAGARRDRGEPKLVILSDPEALAAACAERLVAAITDAVAARSVAHVALCGGSSPVGTYRQLARRGNVPWPAVHLWWVDDRYVPDDHPDSNVTLVRLTLLEADEITARGAPVPARNIHPVPVQAALEGGHDPDWAARAYANEIARHVPSSDDRPIFDVMLLGVGGDGHVMSIFPGSPALAGDAPLVLAVEPPAGATPRLSRITLRAAVADDARALLVVVPDGAKAGIVAAALEGPPDPTALPARIARRAGATWILTRAAASKLVAS